MSILGRASLIIVAISASALAMGNPHHYYHSYYSLHSPHKKDSLEGRNGHMVNADLGGVVGNHPTIATPTQAGPAQAPPAYAPPAYRPPAAYKPPAYRPPAAYEPSAYRPPAAYEPSAYRPPAAYEPPAYQPPAANESPANRLPAVPTMPVPRPPAVSPYQAYDRVADHASAYVPPDKQADKSPADTPTHKPPAGNKAYKPPTDISPSKPPVDTHVEKPSADTDIEKTPADAHVEKPPTGTHVEETPADIHIEKPPADTHVEKPPADTHIEKPPADNHVEKPPTDTHIEKPPEDTYVEKSPAKTSTHNPPNTSTTTTHTDAQPPFLEETLAKSPERIPKFRVPTLPKWGHGKPSPMPNGMDRRNAPRVSRQKRGNVARGATVGAGHSRRLPSLKKRQQAEQHAVIPVTVNMITGIDHFASTSSAPTPTNALPPSQSLFAPEVKVDTSQAALSLQSNPEATMPSVGELAPPVSPNSGSQQLTDFNTGEPRNKAAVIASILSIVIGLVVIVTVVKLTRNAMRKRKHAAGLRQYDEHLSSKEGLIPEMSVPAHFEAHDVIITGPDGSEISPLSSGRGDSPSPLPFGRRSVGYGPSPLPMPTFAPPPTPASPLTLPFVKLLSPTVNLAHQNTMQSRASAMSETMSLSTTSTDNSESRPASDSECIGRQVSHRRMRSAPGSVVWSARSSGATGKLTSGLSVDEGYWESVDVCGSESIGRMVCRSSRGRSVAMSVMW